jgi:hypothetical protein
MRPRPAPRRAPKLVSERQRARADNPFTIGVSQLESSTIAVLAAQRHDDPFVMTRDRSIKLKSLFHYVLPVKNPSVMI